MAHLCILALNEGAKLSPEGIRADIVQRWPELVLKNPDLDATGAVKFEDGALVIDMEPVSVVMMEMPAPIPQESWDVPVGTFWLWPNAAEELRDHKTHLVMTLVGESGSTEAASLLTKIAVSVIQCCQAACGVSWGGTGVMTSADLFCEFAEMLPNDLPLPLWIDIPAGKNEDGTTSAYTRGVRELGLMDLISENATDNVGELRERFLDLISYQLNSGPVIKNGHTVGSSAQEKILVEYCDSPFGHEEKVMRLNFRPKKRGWFGFGK